MAQNDIDRAKEDVRALSELREKLEILTEHVESRKEALEEEIEENLHEAIRNARDCLERIQENLEPKVEKFIRTKLEEIDARMERWMNDGRKTVREEMETASDPLAKKIAHNLDEQIIGKLTSVRLELSGFVKEEVKKESGIAMKSFQESTGKELRTLKYIAYGALGLSAVALALVIRTMF